jgi:hypothetical protein
MVEMAGVSGRWWPVGHRITFHAISENRRVASIISPSAGQRRETL